MVNDLNDKDGLSGAPPFFSPDDAVDFKRLLSSVAEASKDRQIYR